MRFVSSAATAVSTSRADPNSPKPMTSMNGLWVHSGHG
jgi:hypothetical protein